MAERLGVISRYSRHRYFAQLKEMLSHVLADPLRRDPADISDVRVFKEFFRKWIRMGAPVDPQILYIPAPSARVVARQIANCIPTLGQVHADARLWLTEPDVRSHGQKLAGPGKPRFNKPFSEQFVPFNALLYAPEGTPYSAFNKIGFTLEMS